MMDARTRLEWHDAGGLLVAAPVSVDDRVLTAYCTACQEPTKHVFSDVGDCTCTRCGGVQALVG